MKCKFLRKLPALLAAAALLAQPVLADGPAVPAGWTSPFPDVSAGDWFYPYVAQMNALGVMHGYDDGRFGPNDIMRAGDAILTVVKAAGSGTLEPLQDAHYAESYIQYAAGRDWLNREEVPELNGPVSRGLIARLAAKALGLSPSQSASPFADTEDGLITALYRRGLMAGTMENGARLFRPDGSLTRAEASAILWRVTQFPGHIFFENNVLDILEEVPACSWDAGSFVLEDGRMTCAAPEARPALGVDVSSHQGEIDWRAVAGDGVEFAMLRAGGRYYVSGELFEDKCFRQNLEGAAAAGLETGVYFFSQAVTVEEAREEARFLLERLDGRTLDGPVVFDWENISNASARTDGVDPATVTAMADAFCREVEAAGYDPMIYFNQYIAYLLYDLAGVARYPFWIAQYGPEPGFYYDFQMWQYTDAGAVAGVDGPVDLNLRLVPWDQ